ncbi:hypothetical protein EBR21_14345 [bacterium]|nr:hypothetical protein [bacterium]
MSSKYSLRTFWRDVQDIRREARYTILLAQWLEMEAERCATPESLWENFVFFANKLELAEVKLFLRAGELTWRAPGCPANESELERKHHDVHGLAITGIEVAARLKLCARDRQRARHLHGGDRGSLRRLLDADHRARKVGDELHKLDRKFKKI